MEDSGHSSTATLDRNRDHMLFLSTLQEPYYDRLMLIATGSFANMVKAGNLIDHAIKNGGIDIGKSSSKPKRGNFSRKKEREAQTLYQQNNPINLKDTPHTRTTQIINRITQLRVIKCLLWFLITHLPVTTHKQCKHTYLSQTINQAILELTTLRITSPIILDPKNSKTSSGTNFGIIYRIVAPTHPKPTNGSRSTHSYETSISSLV